MIGRAVPVFIFLCSSIAAGCGGWGGGSDWVKQPLVPEEERAALEAQSSGGPAGQPGHKTIGGRPAAKEGSLDRTGGGGKVLGTFRNTYYDFPSESDHTAAAATPASGAASSPASAGAKAAAPSVVPLMNGSCTEIAKVPRTFFEAVCVQGSGSLAKGGTVSFAKRDCACAEICPRTQQRICFDALDKASFPWGRGAAGTPITPLRSVAADTKVLPMGTILYIPELDGVGSPDGCFIVEDRGLRVQGEHVDIFTGQPSQTAALNAQVPSNQGVTVVVDAPKCAHLKR